MNRMFGLGYESVRLEGLTLIILSTIFYRLAIFNFTLAKGEYNGCLRFFDSLPL
jgi:hypothetical protein